MSTIDQLPRDERKDEKTHDFALSGPAPDGEVDVPGRTPPPPDPGPDEG